MDRLYKKTLILGILILFIGASVVPNIRGYTGKTGVCLTDKDPIFFPIK